MKKFLLLLVLAVLAAGAWWIGVPAYRAHKERKFALQARQEFVKGEYRKALLSARQVLVLNQSNLIACAVMADLADLGRSTHAIIWRKRIAETDPSVSNRVILASCALRYEQPPFPVASQTLHDLKGKADEFAPYQAVAAQLALKQGRVVDAESHFEQAIRLEPAVPLHKLNLAVVRLQSSDASKSATAQQQLLAFQETPEWGDYVLRSLAAHYGGRHEIEKALEYSARLLKHPRATFDDRLDQMALLFESKRSGDFATAALQLRSSASTNAVQVFALANRLLACGDADQTLTWLKSLRPEIREEQPVPLALANTYAAVKNWRGLEDYLNSQSWKEQDFVRFAMLAYAVRNQQDEQVSRAHWDKAVSSANDPEMLAMLAQMAAGWQWRAENEQILWRVAKGFPQKRWALDALHNGYARARDSRGLLAVYSLALSHDRTNAVVQNNVAALSFLLMTNLARAHELAQKVFEADTNNWGFVSTYAWSQHLQGRSPQALRLMERIDVAHLEDPSVASYYGALLVAAGNIEKAKAYLAKADASEILPEEKAIVTQARQEIQARQ